MQEVLVKCLGGLSLPRKGVVRLTDRPDMTVDVYRRRKTIIQQQKKSFSEPKLKSLDGSYHSDHGDRDYKTADYLIEKRDVDREKEREKHTYSYTSPSYESKHKYEHKHERVRGEKSYEDEKYTSLETSSR